MIEVEINKTVNCRVPIKLINRSLKSVCRQLKIKKQYQVSLAIVSAPVIKKLNKQYRHQDQITDVLSFVNRQARNKGGDLGEILICYQQLLKQARQKQNSADKEFIILFIHGLLHLLGFDHKTKKQAQIMENIEAKILGQLYD